MCIASTTSSMLNLTGGTDAWGISSCLFGNASQAVGCESESGLLRWHGSCRIWDCVNYGKDNSNETGLGPQDAEIEGRASVRIHDMTSQYVAVSSRLSRMIQKPCLGYRSAVRPSASSKGSKTCRWDCCQHNKLAATS